MQAAYCRWYGQKMSDVADHEQEECWENGQDCAVCPDLVSKEIDEEDL